MQDSTTHLPGGREDFPQIKDIAMSQVTFNIADYRTIAESHIHTVRTPGKVAGLDVVTPSLQTHVRAYAEPGVVDIRDMRDAQRLHRGMFPYTAAQRRTKVLRFRGEMMAPVMNIRALGGKPMENDDLPPAA